MQLLLGFAQTLSDEKDRIPDVWLTLAVEQRNEALDVLARLLAKMATKELISSEENRND